MSGNNKFFEGKHILVAGGTGMIGKPLVQMLLDRGAYVRIASRDNASRAHPQAEFIECNLTYPDICSLVCQGMDIVFNLLCTKGSPSTCQTNPADYLVPMTLYNTHLMEAARRQNIKSFLFTSSVCVYPPSEVFYENDPLERMPSKNDLWAGMAKRVGEIQARAYAIQYGWNNIAVVRPSNVYGPYDNFNVFNAMVVPSLIRQTAEAKDRIVVWGDGTAERDFIYSDDVARGMMLALEKELTPNQPINLGIGFGISTRTLAETVVRVSGKKLEVVYDTSKPSGDKKRIMNISRAREVGFSPQVSLEEGLEKTYRWYIDNQEIANNRYDIFNRPAPKP